MNLPEILIILVIFIIILCWLLVYVVWFVHLGLNRCYLAYALRYCRKNQFTASQFRMFMAFKGRVKTEFTIVELDCLDADHQRKLIRLIIWIFGIREISIEPFPETPPPPLWRPWQDPGQKKWPVS